MTAPSTTHHASARLDSAQQLELEKACQDFQIALDELPEKALGVFEATMRDASTPLVRSSFQQVVGATVGYIQRGQTIRNGRESLRGIVDAYRAARRVDRRVLVASARDTLIGLAIGAENNYSKWDVLEDLAKEFPRLIFGGTAEQQFICKLGVYIGRTPAVPKALLVAMAESLLGALQTILEVGAPVTRDIAIEAIGGLLKHSDDPALVWRVPDLAKEGDDDINQQWRNRLERWRLRSLVVAGQQHAVDEFSDELLKHEIGGQYDRRADLLRTLPAIWRQAPKEQDSVRDRCAHMLCAAAAVLHPTEKRSSQLQLSFARYQESVFRTIELMIERGAPAAAFDTVTAEAMAQLLPTLVATPDVANAQTRASVAIISVAGQITSRADGTKSEVALRLLFRTLNTKHTVWANPGILEGCLRTLPYLLTASSHNVWTRPALKVLFRILRMTPDWSDFAAVHRRAFATACLRHLLIAAAEHVHLKYGDVKRVAVMGAGLRGNEAHCTVANLVSHPTPEQFLNTFQSDQLHAVFETGIVSEAVINAFAFETELLRRNWELFRDWKAMPSARKLLLIRIFAVQLRSAAHDEREIDRYPTLGRFFRDIPSVTLTPGERHQRLLEFLSDMPPGAAEAADADLRDFVEHCSAGERNDVRNLPNYVLAMISDDVSYRLAADIAREIDLNLRQKRLADRNYDFAISLYQVMLRGPNKKIFDHLVPRVHAQDRALVLLFRLHVMQVRACDDEDAPLLPYLAMLIPQLEANGSLTLSKLAAALHLYVDVAEEKPRLWTVMRRGVREGGLHDFFAELDDIAIDTHAHDVAVTSEDGNGAPRAGHPNRRQSVAELCKDECARIREQVSHYVDLEISHFDERGHALREAVKDVRKLEEKLNATRWLQPPERVMLLKLLHTWRNVFERTIEVFVEGPRRCVAADDPESFWREYVEPHLVPTRHAPPRFKWVEKIGRYVNVMLKDGLPKTSRIRAERGGVTEPPIFDEQSRRFENFYVEWMSSELDIDHLKWALIDRWPIWFQAAYAVVTSLRWTLVLIGFPTLFVWIYHELEQHSVEGIGYFGYAVVSLTLLFWALTPHLRAAVTSVARRFWVWVRRKEAANVNDNGAAHQRQYRFPCLLPRLFRLIVVPLALIVDFDHSYHFPMAASSIVIVLLMVLAYLTTTFFVRREIVGHDSDRTRVPTKVERIQERRRVHQIVAIALAHSFALSLLFSMIFEANLVPKLSREVSRIEQESEEPRPAVKPALAVYHDVNANLFLWFLPREATFDLGRSMRTSDSKFWNRARKHFRFDFYPTLIICWTALGLFFGVFLEGFLKGERLRGEMNR